MAGQVEQEFWVIDKNHDGEDKHMKKFLALGVLAAIFFLVPSVQAQEWYGQRGWGQPNYHQWQGPHHRGHQPPPRWEHANYPHGWQQRAWHRQQVRWNYNHPNAGWRYNNYRFR
jgi:hypothetical protein